MLLAHADHARLKVVAIGDVAQLPEIEAGGLFRRAGPPARRDQPPDQPAAAAPMGTTGARSPAHGQRGRRTGVVRRTWPHRGSQPVGQATNTPGRRLVGRNEISGRTPTHHDRGSPQRRRGPQRIGLVHCLPSVNGACSPRRSTTTSKRSKPSNANSPGCPPSRLRLPPQRRRLHRPDQEPVQPPTGTVQPDTWSPNSADGRTPPPRRRSGASPRPVSRPTAAKPASPTPRPPSALAPTPRPARRTSSGHRVPRQHGASHRYPRPRRAPRPQRRSWFPRDAVNQMT
jgi:hypothetical protein